MDYNNIAISFKILRLSNIYYKSVKDELVKIFVIFQMCAYWFNLEEEIIL
jgi:hypothetical protein